MADLSELKPPEGATTKKTRVGRGPGSGQGKTAGRGMKGQKARSGGAIHPRFEGGQTPLYRRLPKFGFSNPNKIDVAVINVQKLNNHFEDGDTVDVETLSDRGLIRSRFDEVKVLGSGELEVELTVRANRFSESAREKIENAGGTAEVI